MAIKTMRSVHVAFVESGLGGGQVHCDPPITDSTTALAVCVAGYKAELAFAAHEVLELSKELAWSKAHYAPILSHAGAYLQKSLNRSGDNSV
jgi:hypothetical protein